MGVEQTVAIWNEESQDDSKVLAQLDSLFVSLYSTYSPWLLFWVTSKYIVTCWSYQETIATLLYRATILPLLSHILGVEFFFVKIKLGAKKWLIRWKRFSRYWFRSISKPSKIIAKLFAHFIPKICIFFRYSWFQPKITNVKQNSKRGHQNRIFRFDCNHHTFYVGTFPLIVLWPWHFLASFFFDIRPNEKIIGQNDCCKPKKSSSE